MTSNQILPLLTGMDHQVLKTVVPEWTDFDHMLVANTYILLLRKISTDIEKGTIFPYPSPSQNKQR